MSGSLTWRSYTTDAGTVVSLFRDESNSDSKIGANTLLGDLVVGSPGLSNLIKPRYVNTVLSTDATRRKRFIVGTLAIYNTIGAGTQITETGSAGGTWNISSKVGERSKIPQTADTGQVDGTPLK
jgi:hypothetical protein